MPANQTEMDTIFTGINLEEQRQLVLGVSWITILIAGVDGHIDSEEIEWAEKIAKIRSYSLADRMHDFYQEVGKDFDENLKHIMEEQSGDKDARTKMASDEVEKLNPILQKMTKKEGAKLYDSFKSFAKHVAKSSGGFLGMWSISYEENKYMNLPMLEPIEWNPEDEDDEV